MISYEERIRLLSADADESLQDFTVDTMKASGHGGQKINKTSSAVRVTHKASGIAVRCMDTRSQRRNRRSLRAIRSPIP